MFSAGSLRRGLHETAEGLKAVAARPPLIPSLIADWLPMVRTFGIVATTNAAYYLHVHICVWNAERASLEADRFSFSLTP